MRFDATGYNCIINIATLSRAGGYIYIYMAYRCEMNWIAPLNLDIFEWRCGEDRCNLQSYDNTTSLARVHQLTGLTSP